MPHSPADVRLGAPSLPLHGPRFPAITIRDDVAASRAVLDAPHIRHLKAVIGFSMGRLRVQGGRLWACRAGRGIQAFSLVWAGWLYSQEWWRRELWRSDTPPLTSPSQAIERYRHIFDGNDANDLILQARTWEAHDVGHTPGFNGDTAAALRSIRVPVLYMPSSTDLYFPLEDARYECGFIRTCLLYPIPSLWGHPAGAGATPADTTFINNHVARFMAGALNRPNATARERHVD